jgi:hypothetical protein
MRSALPRFRDHDEMMVYPIDHTRQVLSRLWGKEMKLELEESEV